MTGIALEAGYYDQAHFIREFKSIAGELPSVYRKNLSMPDFG
ncbi:MAG TPA: hypothetical protein DF409_08685 [Bacteroidales bacterium]|nr:hypothetical protein [Bacteroidales bacterium]